MNNNNGITITKPSVIGAGQIGPDILLHFSKALPGKGLQLVLLDVAEAALKNAQKKIEKKINKSIDTGAILPE